MRKAAGLILCFAVAWMIVFTAHAGAQDVGKFGTLGVHSAWSSPNGTISHYLLNNDATDNAGPMDGAETNITYGADWRGNAASAAVLDGTAYITVNDAPRYDLSRVAVAARIKKDDLLGPEYVVGKYDTSVDKREWAIQANSQKLVVSFGDPTDGTFEGGWESFNNVIVAIDTWYHIAFTYDGTLAAADRVKIYVDGTEVASSLNSGAIPATLYNDTASIIIGAINEGAMGLFSGSIDDVVIATSLRPDEITDLANGVTTSRAMHSTGVMDVGSVFTRSNNTVSHYLLDNDATDNAGPMDGAETNITYGADWRGNAASAAVLDGTAYITVNDAPRYDLSRVAVAARIKKDDLSGVETIVSKFDTVGDKREWALSVQSQKIEVNLGDPADGTDGLVFRSDDNLLSVVGKWYQVAFTFKPGEIILYCDGVAIASSVISGAIPASLFNSTADIIISGVNGGMFNRLSGSIDDVVIATSLRADEITDLSNGVEIPHIDLLQWDNMNAGAIWTPNPVSTDGLVASWQLGEGYESVPADTLQIDTSGNGLHGTLHKFTGDVYVTDRFNIEDGALDFDGVDDYVTVADDPAFNWTTALSVSAWIKVDNLVGEGIVISKWNTSGDKREWEFFVDGDILAVALGDPADGTLEGIWASDNDVITAINTWYYVAFTYDGALAAADRVVFYADGTAVAGSVYSGSIPTTLYNGTSDVLIGAADAGALAPFSGSIADVRLYSRALTGTEIGNIWYATKPY